MAETPRVFIGCPWYKGPRGETAFAMAQSFLRLSFDGLTLIGGIFDCPSIGHARARLVAQFMATDCTHLWLLDHDMIFEPEAIIRLLSHNVPFVGVPGPDKRTGQIYVGSPGKGGGEKSQFRYDRDTGLVEVHRIGACFMLIRRDALEQMMAAYPELHLAHAEIDENLRPYYYSFWQTRAADGHWPTEDYYFCDLLRGAGIAVLADPWIQMSHVVTTTWTGRLIDSMEFDDGAAELVRE